MHSIHFRGGTVIVKYRQTEFTWRSRRRSQAINKNIGSITGIIESQSVSHSLGANMASIIILAINLHVVIVSYVRANTATIYSYQSYIQCVGKSPLGANVPAVLQFNLP